MRRRGREDIEGGGEKKGEGKGASSGREEERETGAAGKLWNRAAKNLATADRRPCLSIQQQQHRAHVCNLSVRSRYIMRLPCPILPLTCMDDGKERDAATR
jgi:hypothetical protein